MLANAFIIKHIKFVGLKRISAETALNYLPIQVGQDFTGPASGEIISSLYQTGFFSNVNVGQQSDTLIITVDERPIISQINITGNNSIPEDKLNEALEKMGFAKGQVFKQATLKEVTHALTEQYYNTGRYNARVEVKVEKQARNRVAVNIIVSEGRIVQVKRVTIVGNHVFSESDLLDKLTLSPPGFFSFFSSSDQFSKDKLEQSLQALRDYYFNRGYIKMRVVSTQTSLTPDRQYIYVVINIKEDDRYTFGQFKLTGDLILPRQELRKLVLIKKGETFSRELTVAASQAITDHLQNAGYAFAKVNVTPSIDEKTKQVNLSFDVTPGKRYYIRNIQFSGNINTTNIVFRNNMLQFESSVYNKGHIQESARNLRQLPYIKADEIKVTPKPVPGSDNQVDVDVNTVSQMSADINFSVGYSQLSKIILGASFSQRNFMGTGKTFGLNASHSATTNLISASYTDPFFTVNGISQSISTYFQTVNPGSSTDVTTYSTDGYGANMSYGFPISNYQRFNLGGGFEHVKLGVNDNNSTAVKNFVDTYGTTFNQMLLTAGWSYNTFNRFIFPTKGLRQAFNAKVSLPLSSTGSLQYYLLTYENRWYYPLGDNFIFTTRAAVGYGDGYGRYKELPFFKNFYAGGLNGLGENRAYAPSTLGPYDSNTKDRLGGNLLLAQSIGVVVPTSFISDKIRTTLFFDVSNVFNTKKQDGVEKNQGVRLQDLRYSAGLQIEWMTPLGAPLVFSLAMPIGYHDSEDTTQLFQFSIGGSF